MKFGPIGVLDALKMSIQITTDMERFYFEAGKHSRDEDLREIFQRYCSEEKRRRKDLQEEYRRISGKRLLYLNLNRRRKVEMSMEYNSDRLSLITTAKINIQSCLNFYAEISGRILESDYRIIFKDLAEEKERQLAVLVSKFPIGDEEEQNLKGITSHSTVSEAA